MSPPSDEIATLLELFLDDRGSLTEEQYAQLVAELRDDPLELSKLKDQLILDEKLGQIMAVDRADFPAQMRQRLRDLPDDLEQQVHEMRAELAREQAAATPRRRRNWTGWALTLCLLLAVSAGAFYLVPHWRDRPRVTRVYGAATLIRESAKTPLVAGEQLRYGDRILTHPQAFATLRYPDGTRVSVASESLLQISSRMRSGKVIEVDRGSLGSEVAPQSSSRPMQFRTPRADAKVVGTELLLQVSADQTRLDVGEGLVELRGLSSDRAVRVEQNEFAVTTGNATERGSLSWPVDRERLEVLLESKKKQDDWELRGETVWDRGLHFQNSSVVLPIADAQAVTRSCQSSNELTLELVLRLESTRITGPARIVSLSTDPFTRNFTLGQSGGYLVFRLRTPETGENGANPEVRLCKLEAREWRHVIITYRPGQLTCYVDGERVSQTSKIQGDFSNWTEHYLTLGDEWNSERSHSWRGKIRALAIYSRALDSAETLHNMMAKP